MHRSAVISRVLVFEWHRYDYTISSPPGVVRNIESRKVREFQTTTTIVGGLRVINPRYSPLRALSFFRLCQALAARSSVHRRVFARSRAERLDKHESHRSKHSVSIRSGVSTHVDNERIVKVMHKPVTPILVKACGLKPETIAPNVCTENAA